MKLVKNEKVINIMEKTLNYVDSRLIDHGKRVAYLIYKILNPQNKFSSEQLRDVSILAMLHDVGAYKTEEIDKMVIFETIDVWEHSIYGHLFLKYFSPLKELAPIILFHHANCKEIEYLDNPEHKYLAQLISICDRADVFSMRNGRNDGLHTHINQNRNIKYRDDIVDAFLASGVNIDTVFDSLDSDAEFNNVFRKTPLTADEVSGYIKMIIYSIDFRSSQTVIHTVATVCIAGVLAGLMDADDNEIEKIKTGAMLHDIGKVGIPIHILENPDRLNDADMAVMRTHVEITERILEGNVDNDVMRIAARHHEKLDGSGYPKRLKINDIDFFDRIVSVADILSALCGARSYKNAYPKEKIVGILSDMSEHNLLDPEMVALSIEHFDTIMEAVNREAHPVIQIYNEMNEEYRLVRNDIENKYKV